MSVRGPLLGGLLLAAVVSCLSPPRPAPATPPTAAAQPAKAPAPPKPSKPDVSGELDPAMVANYVRLQLANVKACYESALKTDRMLVGRIDAHWTIDVDGVARNVAVLSDSTMQTSAVADCVRALIEEWRFPKPLGGSVEVSFPFVFQSHD